VLIELVLIEQHSHVAILKIFDKIVNNLQDR
jgi:hypothetical protein